MTACARTWLLTSLLPAGLALAGPAQRLNADEPAQVPKREPETVVSRQDLALRFDRDLKALWSNDEQVRLVAEKDLVDLFLQTKDLGAAVGVKALRAAARPYPFKRPDSDSVSSLLAQFAGKVARPEYIPVVLEVFDTLSYNGRRTSRQPTLSVKPSAASTSGIPRRPMRTLAILANCWKNGASTT